MMEEQNIAPLFTSFPFNENLLSMLLSMIEILALSLACNDGWNGLLHIGGKKTSLVITVTSDWNMWIRLRWMEIPESKIDVLMLNWLI